MRYTFFAVLMLTICASLRAVVPTPYSLPVDFSCKGTNFGSSGGTVKLTIGIGGGAPSTSVALNGGESGLLNVALQPNRGTYATIDVSLSAPGEYDATYAFQATVPDGYELYIDGVLVDTASEAFMGTRTSGQPTLVKTKIFLIELRRAADYAPTPAGFFSGVDLGQAVAWTVGLGSLRGGQSAGRINFREQNLANSPASRARLYYTAPASSNQLTPPYAPGGVLRQIQTPAVCVDLVDDTSGYWFKFYAPNQVSGTAPFTVNSGQSPWRSIHVESPAANQMKITELEGNSVRVSLVSAPAMVSNNYTWTCQVGGNNSGNTAAITWLSRTKQVSSKPGSYRQVIEDIQKETDTDTVVARTKYLYDTKAWGEELYQVVTDPDGSALTTTYDYFTTSTDKGDYRRIKSIARPTGDWTSFDYDDGWDSRGQVLVQTGVFVDAPSTVQAASVAVGDSVSYTFQEDFSGRKRAELVREGKTTNITTAKRSTDLTNNRVRGGVNYSRAVVTEYAATAATQVTAMEIVSPNNTNADLRGKPFSIERPDQSQDVSAYYSGDLSGSTFTMPGSGSCLRTNTWHGTTDATAGTLYNIYDGQDIAPIYLVANRSTMDVAIQDAAGRLVRTETHIFNGVTLVPVASEVFTYDVAGRLLSRTASNGATTSYTYIDGRMDSMTDVAGTLTQYSYDEIGRLHSSTKKGAPSITAVLMTSQSYAAQGDVTTTYTYDSAGRLVSSVTAGGSLTLTSSTAFDLSGRETQKVAPGGYTTSMSYTAGPRFVTTTFPGGASRTTEINPDGSLKQVSDATSTIQAHAYSIESSSGRRLQQTTVGGISSRWTKSWRDWLGRETEARKPGWTTGTEAVWTFAYNSKGQLDKSTQPGVADTRYGYNSLGQLTQRGLDIGANNGLDAGSNDRIETNDVGFSIDSSGVWWRYTTKGTYAMPSDPTPKILGTTKQRLTGFTSSLLGETRITDIYGNEIVTTTTVDAAGKKVQTDTTVPGSNITASQINYNGLLVEARDNASVVMRYKHDALGRQNESIDPRTGSTVTAYVSGSSEVFTVTDPSLIIQATFAYDAAGRISALTGADSKTKRTSYTARGEIYREWGDATTPVEYAYNNAGQLVLMSTFRGGSGWSGSNWPASPGAADFTRWVYDDPTGLLKEKYDADDLDTSGNPTGTAKKVAYTYNLAGQVKTRTWQRGVVTTYYYFGEGGGEPVTGELRKVGYASSDTPDIEYTYDRLGNPSTVTDYTGVRTFTYNLAGTLELQREDLPSALGTRRVTYEYEGTSGLKGRPKTLKLGTSSNPSADQTVAYDYQADGRLNSITANAAGSSLGAFTYTYTANSHQIESALNTLLGYSDLRTYDPTHDWVDARETKWGTNTKAKFAYAQDALGRVDNVVKTGELFDRYGNGTEGLKTTYAYTERSEVKSEVTTIGTSATILTGRNDSLYAYDSAGNRSSVAHNGHTTNYAPNQLNQYGTITGTGGFDVAAATAVSGAPTLVNGVRPAQHGKYTFQDFFLNSGGSNSARLSQETIGITADPSVSIDGLISFNYGYNCSTPSVTGQSGSTVTALQFEGQPFHVGIDASLHNYPFQNGQTYTFGYWARTLGGTRTVTVCLTDDINSGVSSATYTIGSSWQWVSVTKTFSSLGAAPRCFYTWDGGGQAPFQAYGAQITSGSPRTKSINGLVSFNYPSYGCPTVNTTGPTGLTVDVMQLDGHPYHVAIEASAHNYPFQNGRTYTFGFWARTLTGTRPVTAMLTDDYNSGTSAASYTVGTDWQWVSVTKTYGTLGSSPRCFYTWEGDTNLQPIQVYGAQIADITNDTYATNQTAYVSASPVTPTYDADGNLIDDGRWTYSYDSENRMRWVETASAAVAAGHPRVVLSIFYDYLGRRVRKVNGLRSGSTVTWDQDRRMIYNGWNLIAEFYGTYGSYSVSTFASAQVRHSFWGLDITGTGSGAGGVGGLLLVQEAGNSYLPMYDANGNVHGLLKSTDGSIAAAYEYDASGQTIRESGTYATNNPFRFSTKYTDVETGLVYYGLRYYSPSLGRFINKDPIEEKGGLNLYAFCLNNGVNRWDHLGMRIDTAPQKFEYMDGGTDSMQDSGLILLQAQIEAMQALSKWDKQRAADEANDIIAKAVKEGHQAVVTDTDGNKFVITPSTFHPTSNPSTSAGGNAGAGSSAKQFSVNMPPIEYKGEVPDSGTIIQAPAQSGVPCIQCHGVSADGFSGNVNDFAGLSAIPGSGLNARQGYRTLVTLSSTTVTMAGPSVAGGLARLGAAALPEGMAGIGIVVDGRLVLTGDILTSHASLARSAGVLLEAPAAGTPGMLVRGAEAVTFSVENGQLMVFGSNNFNRWISTEAQQAVTQYVQNAAAQQAAASGAAGAAVAGTGHP